jgi:hypothetical protein
LVTREQISSNLLPGQQGLVALAMSKPALKLQKRGANDGSSTVARLRGDADSELSQAWLNSLVERRKKLTILLEETIC